MDSNHRRHKPADLQSAPFGHFGTSPSKSQIVDLKLRIGTTTSASVNPQFTVRHPQSKTGVPAVARRRLQSAFVPQTRDYGGQPPLFVTLRAKAGAGDGNRTHLTSLEGWRITTMLRPHSPLRVQRYISGFAPSREKAIAQPQNSRIQTVNPESHVKRSPRYTWWQAPTSESGQAFGVNRVQNAPTGCSRAPSQHRTSHAESSYWRDKWWRESRRALRCRPRRSNTGTVALVR